MTLDLAVRQRPTAHADGAEYLLTAESLLNHGTPNVHPADLLSFGRIAVRHPLEGDFGHPLSHYLSAPDRRLYGVHFWAYPALALPAKLVLRLSGGNEFKAFQVTSVLFALGALAHVLFFSGLSRGARRLLATLLVASPFVPFLLWPHPEVATGALVTSSLVFRHDGRRVAAVLAMALASLQAAPLALAAALFWAEGARAARSLGGDARLRSVGRLSLALAPTLLPALFSLVAFGHPSPLVLAGAYDRRHVSVSPALELLVDPNLGLLPYVPMTLALALVLALVRLARRGTEPDGRPNPAWLLAALALVALSSTDAANWNHGTVGPSRYGLWLLPFVFLLLAEALEGSAGRGSRIVLPLAVLAALTQATIAFAPGRRPRPRGLHAALPRRPLGPRALARPLQPDAGDLHRANATAGDQSRPASDEAGRLPVTGRLPQGLGAEASPPGGHRVLRRATDPRPRPPRTEDPPRPRHVGLRELVRAHSDG